MDTGIDVPDPKKSVRAGFAELLAAIQHCALHELTTPALILVYSAIDIAGWLDATIERPPGERFRGWVERYLLPAQPTLECTAEDLWGARCGLVHTMSPDSHQSAKGAARRIYYSVGDSSSAPLQEMLEIFRAVTTQLVELQALPPIPTDIVMVRVNDLVSAFQVAVDRFLTEVEAHPHRVDQLLQKAMQVFMTLSDEDVRTRVSWARGKLRDIELS